MIVKVFRGISKDFAELTKTAQMEKLQIILVLISECFFFLLYHSLIKLLCVEGGFRTIQRYLAEEKKCGQLQAPKKPDRKCMIQLDEHQKCFVPNLTPVYTRSL
jgi:hypothetical protein